MTLEHSATPVPEEPEMAGEVRQLRSSEARILLDSFTNVVNQMSEVSADHLRLAGEVGRNSTAVQAMRADVSQLKKEVETLGQLISDLVKMVQTGRERIESMRPKVDSVPLVAGEIVDRMFEHRELAGFREQQETRKTLKIEVYKVAIGVILAALLGLASKIGFDVLVYEAGHPRSHETPTAR